MSHIHEAMSQAREYEQTLLYPSLLHIEPPHCIFEVPSAREGLVEFILPPA